MGNMRNIAGQRGWIAFPIGIAFRNMQNKLFLVFLIATSVGNGIRGL